MDAGTFLDKLEAVDIKRISEDVLTFHAEELADANREQLRDGLGIDGQYLSPSYLQDPYFNDQGAALRYMEWKSRISPSRTKPDEVPDFFINGRFHGSIFVEVRGTMTVFVSHDYNADDILAKSPKVLGLSQESIHELREAVLYPDLILEIKEQLR